MSEGGQRCAAHTKSKLERAAADMRSAAVNVSDKTDLTRFNEARHNWEEAAVEYASTPSGAAALALRCQEAEDAEDTQTAAMLTTIIRRGEQMRTVNAEIATALKVGAFTETGLPDIDVNEVSALDENDNDLSEEDRKAWVTLVEAVAAKQSPTNPEPKRYCDNLIKADKTVASTESDDTELSWAIGSFTAAMQEHSEYVNPRRVQYFDEDSHTRGVSWTIRSVLGTKEAEPVLQAQVRRAMDHPNAGPKTFTYAQRGLLPNDVYGHPQCPDENIGNVPPYVSAQFNDATWAKVHERSATSLYAQAVVARDHPSEFEREEAQQRLVATQWESTTPTQMRYLRQMAPACLTETQNALVQESMLNWVRHFGSDEHKSRVLTSAEQNPQPVVIATPESTGRVSLLRRTSTAGSLR